MKVDMIVTLKDNKRYILVDESIQNGKKYFLGTRIDEDGKPVAESEIFEELLSNNETYLLPVEDKDVFNTLTAVFISKFKDLMKESQ